MCTVVSDAAITLCFSQGTFEYNFTDPGEYDVEVMLAVSMNNVLM